MPDYNSSLSLGDVIIKLMEMMEFEEALLVMEADGRYRIAFIRTAKDNNNKNIN